MIILEGKAVFEGVAIGRLSIYKKSEQSVKREKVEDTDVTVSADDCDAKIISYVYVGFNDGMKIEHHKLSYNELVSFIKKIQPLCLV